MVRQRFSREGDGASAGSSPRFLWEVGEGVGDETLSTYGMKVARTGSYRPPRIGCTDSTPDASGAAVDEEGVGGSPTTESWCRLIDSRIRETGEAELPRVVCDAVRDLANMAGRRLAENVDSSQRGSGWSVNGGGRTTREVPEASGA